NEFLKMGHEVIIYTFSLQYPKLFFPGKTQYATRPAPENIDIRVKVNSINPFNWLKIGWEIGKLNPDFLVIRYWLPFMAPCLGTIAFLAKLNRKTRVVAITDNIIPHERRIGDRTLTKYFINQCHGFVTLSKSVLEQLRNLENKGKPKVYSPHPLYDNFGDLVGREVALKKLKLSDDYRYLLFFGFIRAYKGLDILLKAMSDDTVKELPVKLIVAGEFYTSEIEYLKIIQELGLGNRVILHTEFIPNELVSYYFCASDLVVQPYKDASQSGVTQIAYHFNRPMVVSNVGALPEMVPNNVAGFVVNPEPSEVAAAIYKYFSQNLMAKFQKGVIAQKDRFTWDKLVNAILSVGKKKSGFKS
ncbi:MAG: glycosyltransferase, partial [Bacteroidota bacterium]